MLSTQLLRHAACRIAAATVLTRNRACKQVVDSDHQIQADKPELVVAAIREAMALKPSRGGTAD